MSDVPPPVPPDPEAVREQLLQCARMLRSTRHMDPEAQNALAELVTELASCVDLDTPTAPASQLAESSTNLVQALHDQQDEGLIAAARHRLEEVAARAEAEAPVATGVVRRFIDALAGIGI